MEEEGKYFKYFSDIIESYDATVIAAYSFLLGRLETFAQYVDCQEYSISREDIAKMLGFKLTKKEKK